MTFGNRITFVIIILSLLSVEAFSCSCSRAWRNSFLSNVGRFDIVALGTIGRSNSDDELGSYLTLKKLYKGKVKDSVINLTNGGLDCRHMWVASTDVDVVVGLFQQNKNEEQFYGAGCITSVLVLNEDNKLISDSNQIGYAGQVRKPTINWLFKKMSLRGFERRVYWKTLFHEPGIKK